MKHKQILTELKSGKEIRIMAGIYFLCLTLVSISLPRSWSLYPLGITLFFGLAEWITDFRENLKLFRQKLLYIIPLVLYFIIHATGLLFSTNLVNVIDKLMFILIPVIGFPIFINNRFMININLILKSFIYGILFVCLLECVYGLLNSLIPLKKPVVLIYEADSQLSPFRHEQLSLFEHPTYLSMKVIFTLVLILQFKRELGFSNTLIFLTVIILLGFIFLLSSLTGLVILTILLLIFLYRFFRLYKIAYLLAIILPVIILVTYRITSLNSRWNNKINVVLDRYKTGESDLRNIDPRFLEWFTAIDLIQKSPLLGVGIDSREILANEYKKNGYEYEASLKLNAHNQFLETQLAFGIPGSIVLLWMVLFPLIKRKKTWNPDLINPFMIIICVSMFFESILVRQWGIMFFVLFYCILLLPDKPVISQTIKG
ncbi:MAG TPA: hypothetical protein DDW27_19310 [Bacteroidales bacterium]|nr:hypothetical protein [Bacteroidales bacterium]